MKKVLYIGLAIVSISLYGGDVKNGEVKASKLQENTASKPIQQITNLSEPKKEVKKKKQYYPRGTIATH